MEARSLSGHKEPLQVQREAVPKQKLEWGGAEATGEDGCLYTLLVDFSEAFGLPLWETGC